MKTVILISFFEVFKCRRYLVIFNINNKLYKHIRGRECYIVIFIAITIITIIAVISTIVIVVTYRPSFVLKTIVPHNSSLLIFTPIVDIFPKTIAPIAAIAIIVENFLLTISYTVISSASLLTSHPASPQPILFIYRIMSPSLSPIYRAILSSLPIYRASSPTSLYNLGFYFTVQDLYKRYIFIKFSYLINLANYITVKNFYKRYGRKFMFLVPKLVKLANSYFII